MFSKAWEGKEGEVLVSYAHNLVIGKSYLIRKLVHIIDCLARSMRECILHGYLSSADLNHRPWLKLNPIFMRDFNNNTTFLRNNFRAVLDEHRRTLGQRAKPDMVDVMLSEKEDGKGLTDDDIIDQIMTFFFAGVCDLTECVGASLTESIQHDTTAHTLAWAVHHISCRPDVEAKVHGLLHIASVSTLTCQIRCWRRSTE